MVDWSLDANVEEEKVIPERKIRQKTRSKNPNLSGLRKSKPLGSSINKHLLHSRKKQSSHKTLAVRKVKRDSFGNIVSSR